MQVIRLIWDDMAVQDGRVSCPNDVVQIYDGGSTSSPRISRMCGFYTPADTQGPASSMHITFSANRRTHYRGFRLNYINVGRYSVNFLFELYFFLNLKDG